MRKFIFLLYCTLCIPQVLLHAQAWQWAKNGGGAGIDKGQGVSHDGSGNVYVTGSFTDTAVFGSFTLAGNIFSNSTIFVVKYDPAGNVLWAREAGDPDVNDQGYAVSADAQGNCYVTGYYSDTLIFGPDTLVSSGAEDIFVAKYDGLGNELWARTAGGPTYNDVGFGVSTDGMGNAYITGYITGVAFFGSFVLTGSGTDIFIAKYDASGAVMWARNAGSTADDQGRGIITDAGGTSFVTGYFQGNAAFGSFNFTSAGSLDAFIARYDASGNVTMALQAGGVNADVGNGISMDALNDIYITGISSGSAFAAKYYPAFTLGWWDQAQGNNRAYGIATTQDGNSVITGSIAGASTIGSIPLTPSNQEDIFIARFDSSGNAVWAYSTGGSAFNTGYSVSIDDGCHTWVTGYFDNTANFGSNALTGNSSEAFLTKLDACITGENNNDGTPDLLVYPDPAADELWVRCECPGATITITDLWGRPVLVSGQDGAESKLTIDALAPGFYFIGIGRSGSLVRKQFIKQ